MTALEAREAWRRFGHVEALRGLSFTVEPGELFGLVGPDGAGKTTTIRALAGLLDLQGGLVRVLGHDPIRQGKAVREALGMMPERYSLYGDLTVRENLRFFGKLYCLSPAAFRERVGPLLELTRLAPFQDRRADALSGGMYKKLALACALLHRPQVLLLDEPTNGVDPVSRRELWDLLYEFVSSGMAILISTPSMDEAERCHRVALIHQGRLLAQGEPRELVRALPEETYDLDGGDRAVLERLLTGHRRVRLLSASGARLRVLVEPGGAREVSQVVAEQGARLERRQPCFEDLFLLRLAEQSGEGG